VSVQRESQLVKEVRSKIGGRTVGSDTKTVMYSVSLTLMKIKSKTIYFNKL